MNEGRIVLCVFGVVALVLIALPLSAVWTRTPPTAPDQALDGTVSEFFREAETPVNAGKTSLPIKGTDTILPIGMTQQDAFKILAASGFSCEPDAASAACFRPYKNAQGCPAEWRVRVSFDATGNLSASDALSTTNCS